MVWIEDLERDGWRIGLALEATDEGPRVREAMIRVPDDADPIPPSEIGRLPWGRYLRTAIAAAVVKAERAGTGVNLEPASPDDARRLLADHHGARRRGSRVRVTRSRLARIAELYREAEAAGLPTGAYIAEAEGVSAGTARSYVARARTAGLLGPADSTRGGER
jgi:hypothetical protein